MGSKNLSETLEKENVLQDKLEPFENPDLSFEERVKDLVSRMNLKEKISQLKNNSPKIERLGIPAYQWWNEALHGYAGPFPKPYIPGMGTSATVFPQAIGLAATWDPDLVRQVSDVITDEARAVHEGEGRNFWSPVINLARDPRWGRTEECYGEDSYLASSMGVAFVKGLQDKRGKYLKAIATPKHYALNNEESRRHSGSSNVDERMMREYYLAPFEACIKEGGAEAVMGAYNAVNGVPCCCNEELLKEILRGEWGFEGHVVSDCGAIWDIYAGHEYAEDLVEAVGLSVEAGCDMACGGVLSAFWSGFKEIVDFFSPLSLDEFLPCLHEFALVRAVEEGLVSEKSIDEAVSRVLMARFKLGNFDPVKKVPFSNSSKGTVNEGESKNLALKAARESIVLLKNEENVLPLDSNDIDSVAVIGKVASEVEFGGYSGKASSPVSPLEGIKRKVSDSVKVEHEKAYGAVGGGFGMFRWVGFKPPFSFGRAVGVAEGSDVAIVFVCIKEGEEFDRDDLRLPGSQEELIEEVSKVNENTIIVLNGGSAVGMGEWIDDVSAVVDMWYGGEEGGKAIADVLFGDYNPAGRLPLTFYKSVDELPPLDDYDLRKGRTYMYKENGWHFPFGHGLSYTEFEYSGLEISSEEFLSEEKVEISLDVENIGDRAGDEVVQLYVHDVERSTQDQPRKQLKGFERIRLDSGEKKNVNFELEPEDLAFYDEDLNFIIEPGEIGVMVGGSSEDVRLTGSFEIKKEIEVEK